jgi:hypothetical protein
MTADELSPYPDDAPVLVRYPLTREQERGDRESWSWLPGTIMQRCGPDEWQVCVEAREMATLEDGTRPPEDASHLGPRPAHPSPCSVRMSLRATRASVFVRLS